MTGRTLAIAPAAAPEMRGRKRRNLVLAIVVPLLLAIAYLAGMSGADARSNAIPALIVNQDEMVEQVGVDGTTTPVVAGRLLVTHLTSPERSYGFDWGLSDAQSAADALTSGEAYVVVTIPSDFSASVVSLGTDSPRAAQLLVETDQSHDYLSGQAAQALADAVTAEFGTELTEMVAIGLVQGMDATGAALQQAADGAGALASGATQLGTGFDQYAAGQQQITDGISQSATGAHQLADGVGQYTAGVGQYVSGASQFASGASQFANGVTQYTGGVDQFAGGVTQYTAGVDQLAGGLAQLNEAAAPLNNAADQIDGATAGLSDAVEGIDSAHDYYDQQVKPGLDQVAASGETLAAMCAELPDPARQAECRTAAGTVTQAAGGASGFMDQVFSETDGLGAFAGGLSQLTSLSDGLRQLAGGISQSADGAAQLSAGSAAINDGAAQLTGSSAQLNSAASQLTSGATQLTAGGTQLTAGGAPLSSGATALADGLTQLSDGQAQLAAGTPQLRDGITQLGSGASQLQAGLQEGADRATGALGDPEHYAGVLAHPVAADVQAQHDPGWGGLIAAIVLPMAAWLAAFITSLARRLITPEGIASTATTGRLVGRALARLGVPVLAATLLAGLAAHLFGAPWVGLVGTLAIGVLLAAAVTGLHLLFVALWGRRMGAVASLAALTLQVLALRGFLPLELRAGWVEVLATISPMSHAAAGLQLIYAGGSPGAVAMAFAGLGLIAALAVGAAWVVVERSRGVALGRVVNLRALGLPLRAPDPVGT